MNLLEEAISAAVNIHEGQRDKGGAPYILHPLRVMFACHGEDERIVAVLHDAMEDHPITRDYMARTFPAHIEALDAITRRDGEAYSDFILRCKANPIARVVKLADLADNMDMSRIKNPKPSDLLRLKKYRQALEVLK